MISDQEYFDALLSKSQKKIRKKWLCALILFALLGVSSLFDLLDSPASGKIRSTQEIIYTFAILGFKIVQMSIPCYLLYHCSYKHPGTKYLIFNLIVLPLATLRELVNGIKNIIPLQTGSETYFIELLSLNAFLILCISGIVWFEYLGWRVRNINKIIQKAKKLAKVENATLENIQTFGNLKAFIES